MLSSAAAASVAITACLIAALIEGICAGRHVRSFFETVRFPRYSPPLWVWSCIGGAYYFVFGFLLYRLLSLEPPSGMRTMTLAFIGFMMFGNGLSNLAIFRFRNLHVSYVIGNLFAVLDIVLLFLVARLDTRRSGRLGTATAPRRRRSGRHPRGRKTRRNPFEVSSSQF